jgi:16S rRNA (uracil1498-N3)-methyltransferase
MHRFYLPPEQCRGPALVLSGREAHHAEHVFRLRRGDRLVVLNGAGDEFLCEVLEPRREEMPLAIVQKTASPPLPWRLTLLQAVPKAKLIECIIQKATELGVSRIVPILSERTVPQLGAGTAEARVKKWRQIAIEAIKQCGNPWLPLVESPLTPKEFLARGERFDLPLIASLQSDRRHLREHFRTFLTAHSRPPQSLCVWIGPEGDFTPAEMSAIKADGALPITLGPLILRSETAAIYALSILNYELQACLPPACA